MKNNASIHKILITTLWLHFIRCRCSYYATIKTSVFRWCSFCYQFIDAQQCIVVEGSSTEAVMSAWRGVVGTFSCKWVQACIVLTNVSIFLLIVSINHLTTKRLPTSLLFYTTCSCTNCNHRRYFLNLLIRNQTIRSIQQHPQCTTIHTCINTIPSLASIELCHYATVIQTIYPSKCE